MSGIRMVVMAMSAAPASAGALSICKAYQGIFLMYANTIRTFVIGGMLAALLAGCATTGGQASRDASPDYDQGGRKAVTVKQTERGATITSDERILFDTGKAEITQNGDVFIERVAKMLKDKTKANVAIEGHTDNVGGAALNQQLSDARARAVMNALAGKGVPKSRMTVKGFGMTKPQADNATPEGRQANRRVEITVLGENAEKLGGTSLADNLSAGLDRFLKDAGAFIQNVFGGERK